MELANFIVGLVAAGAALLTVALQLQALRAGGRERLEWRIDRCTTRCARLLIDYSHPGAGRDLVLHAEMLSGGFVTDERAGWISRAEGDAFVFRDAVVPIAGRARAEAVLRHRHDSSPQLATASLFLFWPEATPSKARVRLTVSDRSRAARLISRRVTLALRQ